MIVLAGLVVLWFGIRSLWSIALPALLALLLSSILWPLNRGLRRVLPKALAALLSLASLLAAVAAAALLVLPSISAGSRQLVGMAGRNLRELSDFVAGLPFAVQEIDFYGLLNAGVDQLREHSSDIVSGITAGLGTVTSLTLVFLLTLVFTFFCLKDGDRFLPWASRWTNNRAFVHAVRVSEEAWQTLSAYILAQATVALADAVFIGLALWLLDVPLALALTVMIFFAGFIPVVGAVTTGVLATMVTLVAHGWVTALVVLGIVLVVQQLESNILQPFLVGKTLKLHPAVVLGSVTVGGTLFGIVGAFLAVPTTAVAIVVLRYLRDQSLLGSATAAAAVPDDDGVPDGGMAPATAGAAGAGGPTP
nr:AI-2E family transporter [Arthrobacter jiangjiafuii]